MMWHFYQMPKFLLLVWKNYILFTLDFFSAPLLFATLFSPWRKYKWRYPRGFDIAEYFNTFISNFFSRIIGAVCRFFLIITSVVFLIAIWFAGAAVILTWVLIPFIFIALILLLYGI
ncbi:MAG: hypothetical protein A2908_02910 [Candidatus Staskawiczbacteria bacterium RIFCSPLOWO2_01_FULL_38_12b]|uniref:Uncharacterized protein n=1 Tax=Candidatus Staskawiczbacteria bacterium RIFCSPLOWO2_01_FULL_38_12b TaxID=1802214 RepID=A0A1G2IGD2_9BACT|nr:MAG: hypothetical protein A2908_02910 [Candidatus Staskawiczbacteria bacterium RIFCSPLOWO2_01_FULL_38_12b]